MLKFKIEWEDQPRVQDRLQRATWARIEIHARDSGREVCLTDCVGRRSHSLRQGVYGSAFPLARWVVENWWSLLWESLRTERFGGGRAHASDAALLPWVQRHNLLSAREGFALPDLPFYRDASFAVLRCVPDPFDLDSPYPVRFVADADFRLPHTAVRAGLHEMVEVIADRIREQVPADSEEAQEFLGNWEAVHESARNEPRLCEAAAEMGIDPYDPGELTDELVALLDGPFARLVPALRVDLAESATGPTLSADLRWVQDALEVLGDSVEAGSTAALLQDVGDEPAHQFGYTRARRFREQFQFPARVSDLEGIMRDQCGWDPEPATVLPTDGIANRIKGLVGVDKAGHARVAASSATLLPESRRFLLGRALFFSPEAGSPKSPRLLTRSNSWAQRASRAFAAELLAPASEIAQQVSREVNYEQVSGLAKQFGVSELVIRYQLENHRIAAILDL